MRLMHPIRTHTLMPIMRQPGIKNQNQNSKLRSTEWAGVKWRTYVPGMRTPRSPRHRTHLCEQASVSSTFYSNAHDIKHFCDIPQAFREGGYLNLISTSVNQNPFIKMPPRVVFPNMLLLKTSNVSTECRVNSTATWTRRLLLFQEGHDIQDAKA